jgi:hypothetical protein
MKNGHLALLGLSLMAGTVEAQDPRFIPEATQDVGYGGPYIGPGSVGSGEPLFRYDDQERWKHGWVQNMPYYEGFHSFRPYNYHHVFSQAQTAAGWGMPATMPYSQQFWHRYAKMTDLSRGDHSPVAPYVPPPSEFDHYPKPLRQGTFMLSPPPSPEQPPLPPGSENSLPPQTLPSANVPAASSGNIIPTQGISPTPWSGFAPTQPGPLLAPF